MGELAPARRSRRVSRIGQPPPPAGTQVTVRPVVPVPLQFVPHIAFARHAHVGNWLGQVVGSGLHVNLSGNVPSSCSQNDVMMLHSRKPQAKSPAMTLQPWLASTSTPAELVSHSLPRTTPSQPQTGSKMAMRGHAAGRGLHVPVSSTLPHELLGKSQNSPGRQAPPPRPPHCRPCVLPSGCGPPVPCTANA